MNTRHTLSTLITGCIGLTVILLAQPASAAPGNGWGVFNTCNGGSQQVFQDCQADRLPTRATIGAAPAASAGQGYDTFRACAANPLPAVLAACDRDPVSRPSHQGSARNDGDGEGWNLFRAPSMALS